MIRKITVIVASGDADTQWRRIRKSTEPRAEHPTERGIRKSAEPRAEHPTEQSVNNCFTISLKKQIKRL